MYLRYPPIIESLFPAFILGETNFNNTLKNRMFTHLEGPFSPSEEWALMFQRWEPIKYLQGGTLSMRAAGEKYLPRARGEVDTIYYSRLCRAVLFEAYTRTVDTLSALPFLTPTQAPNLPTELQYLMQHANGSEDTLEVLCRSLLSDMLHYGKAHILVDYPTTPEEVNLSMLDEMEMNIRPYMVRLDPINVIGWKYEYVGSQRVLTQIRIAETVSVTDPDDEWSEIQEPRVRVITPNTVEVYRQYRAKTQSGNTSRKVSYELVESKPNFFGKINVVTIYANKTGFMTSKPVLEGLAHLNIQHFNKQSDLDNISHVASVPFLLCKGKSATEVEGLEITTHGMFCMEDPDGSVNYVEHSGKAIGSLQAEIQNLEKRMVAMGADTLASRPTATRETAASKIMDNTKSNSVLKSAVLNLEVGISEAFDMAAQWLDLDLQEDFKVNIGDKMELSVDANELTSLLTLLEDGYITPEEATLELRRRGTISESTSLKKPINTVTTESIQANNPQTFDNNLNTQ